MLRRSVRAFALLEPREPSPGPRQTEPVTRFLEDADRLLHRESTGPDVIVEEPSVLEPEPRVRGCDRVGDRSRMLQQRP